MKLEHVVLGVVSWFSVSVLAAAAWARAARHARAGLPEDLTLDGDLGADEMAGAAGPADAATLVAEALADSAWPDLGALQDRIAGRREARRVAAAGEGHPVEVAVSTDADSPGG